LRVQWAHPRKRGGNYRALVFLVLDEEVWTKDSRYREVAMKAFNEFVAALSHCEGITVNGTSTAVNGARFTWQLARQTDQWDFANLTNT
jgi:hypothetical protein